MLELNKIYCGDCLELMKEIEDKSIDLVIADPPYYKIMKQDWAGNKYDWDNQWNTLQDYIVWIQKVGSEISRVLKDNGSFYIFADDLICAYVQVELDKQFNLENAITWYKPNNMTIKGWSGFRSYAPVTERILFYSKEINKTGLQEIYENPDCFKSIKKYMREQRDGIIKINGFLTQEEFNQYINVVSNTASVVSRHYFSDSQWVFPTKEIYTLLQKTGFFRREYEELRAEYEELRRPFNPKQNYTDVWKFNIMGGTEISIHPTQKPINLIKRIVETSSKIGGIVLDPFLGSGTTAEACIHLERKYIGIEKDSDHFKDADNRIKNINGQNKITEWF